MMAIDAVESTLKAPLIDNPNNASVEHKEASDRWKSVRENVDVIAHTGDRSPRSPQSPKGKLHHEHTNVDADRDEAVDVDDEGNLILINVGKLEDSSRAPAHIAAATFIIYVVSGLIVGVYVEGWDIQVTVYFIVVTLTTVGYGDYGFTHLSKWFDALFVLVGVVFVGAAFGVIADFLWQRGEGQVEALDSSSPNASRKEEEHKETQAPTAMDIESDLAAIWTKMYRSIVELLIVLVVGAAVFHYLEQNLCGNDIQYDEAFYWATVTATTVGYGDVVPTCDESRTFATGFICVAFLYIANALLFLGSMPMEIRKLQQQNRVLVQFGESLDSDELKALLSCQTLKELRCKDEQDNRFITRTEFALWVLLQADVLDMGWLNKCFNIFDILDADGSGVLDQDDIDLIVEFQEQVASAAQSESSRDEGTTNLGSRRSSRKTINSVALRDIGKMFDTKLNDKLSILTNLIKSSDDENRTNTKIYKKDCANA